MSQKEPRGLFLSLVSLGAELYTAISLCFSSPEENTVGYLTLGLLAHLDLTPAIQRRWKLPEIM